MNQPDPNSAPPRRRTNPWAIVGIVLASCLGLMVVVVAVLAVLLTPAFGKARDAARGTLCLSNAKQLGTALAMYTQDYDEIYPPASTWQEGLNPYVAPRDPSGTSAPSRSVFECPSRQGVMPGYAFNRQLAGKSLSKIANPRQMPAIFESSLGTPNASDSLESFTTPHRNRHRGTVGFADGRAEQLEEAPPASGGS